MRCPALDDLTLLALTVWGEARGEPFDGQVAVAHVIMNRARDQKPIAEVVLKPWQFSFFNTEDSSRPRIGAIDEASPEWWLAYKAAAAAFFDLIPDTTNGATHYLNVEATKKITGGRLPAWAAKPGDATQVDERKVMVAIGRHVFLVAG